MLQLNSAIGSWADDDSACAFSSFAATTAAAAAAAAAYDEYFCVKLCFLKHFSHTLASDDVGNATKHNAHACSLVSNDFVWNLQMKLTKNKN